MIVEIGVQTRTAVGPVVGKTQWAWKPMGLYHQLLGEEGEEGSIKKLVLEKRKCRKGEGIQTSRNHPVCPHQNFEMCGRITAMWSPYWLLWCWHNRAQSQQEGREAQQLFSSWEQNLGCHHVPMDVIKIPTMSPSASKEETPAFLGFGELHVPG